MSQHILHQLQVPARHSGERLDQAAAGLFPDYSRARLQKWIRDGELTVDGEAWRPSRKLAGGEWLRLEAQLEAEGVVEAQDLPLAVVFADADLLVINKPAGLVVHPAAGNPDRTLQNALLHYDPQLDTLPRSGIVHRLDKDTTGVMVVARSLRAHAALVAQLQSRAMSRVYQAVVHGQVPARGTVDAPIGRHPVDRKRMAVVERGKPAVSHFKVLQAFGHFSHVQVALESGRTHQIRVHMQHLGWPLVGDPTYGRRLPAKGGPGSDAAAAVQAFARQALHAHTLKLVHPADGESRSFSVPLPDDLQGLLHTLAQADPA
jgi:23S rRNA pseudouridine1911/1915/1917 synthase